MRVPAPGGTGFTCAVNVTLVPMTDGFGALVRLVVVFALLTVCPMVTDTDGSQFASPRYSTNTL